jgi:hypothetical protein
VRRNSPREIPRKKETKVANRPRRLNPTRSRQRRRHPPSRRKPSPRPERRANRLPERDWRKGQVLSPRRMGRVRTANAVKVRRPATALAPVRVRTRANPHQPARAARKAPNPEEPNRAIASPAPASQNPARKLPVTSRVLRSRGRKAREKGARSAIPAVRAASREDLPTSSRSPAMILLRETRGRKESLARRAPPSQVEAEARRQTRGRRIGRPRRYSPSSSRPAPPRFPRVRR